MLFALSQQKLSPMRVKKVLVVNAAGYLMGDTSMFLMGLSRLSSTQFHIHVVSAPRGEVYNFLQNLPNVSITKMEVGGVEKHPLQRFGKPARAVEAILAVPKVVSLIKNAKIDMIYTLDRTVGMAISYAASLITGCPLILSAHASFYLESSHLHRRVIKHARLVTVVSEHMRGLFSPYASDTCRIVPVPNAIKVDRYDINLSGHKIRQEFDIPPEAPVVILAGRIDPYKGQDDLIRAAAILLKERPDTYFMLAGAEHIPGYKLILEKLIVELGIEHRVKFIGYRNDLPAVLASANVSTMPSHEEPFGLVALEAMAMSKPVVATRAGGVPEFLVDGEMGLLVQPRDYKALAKALLEIINDPSRAQLMGIKGRQQVERYYNDEVYGQKIAALLLDVASGTNSYPYQHSSVIH